MHIGVQNEDQAKYIKYNSWQSKGIQHRALTKTQFIAHELVPLLTRGIAHFTWTEILTHPPGQKFSLIPLGRKFYTADDSPSPDTSQLVPVIKWERTIQFSLSKHVQILRQHLSGEHPQPTIQILRILHSRRLSPNERGGRFNFPGQTCPNPPATLIQRTSAANDSDSPDSLARQTLTTRRIHFRPQSKSKPRQYWQPSLLNYHSSLNSKETLRKGWGRWWNKWRWDKVRQIVDGKHRAWEDDWWKGHGDVMSCGQWVYMKKYGDRNGGQALHDSMHVNGRSQGLPLHKP